MVRQIACSATRVQYFRNFQDHKVISLSDQLNAKAGRRATFNEDALDTVLSLNYKGQLTFLALSLLYDECGWGTMTFHQDHIFPRILFTPKALAAASHTSWDGMEDRLGNLALLWSRENQEKSDRPFDEWLATRDASFKRRHLIPEDPSLWKFERFDEFLAAREKLIRKRLIDLLGAPAIQPETFERRDSDRAHSMMLEAGPVEARTFDEETVADSTKQNGREPTGLPGSALRLRFSGVTRYGSLAGSANVDSRVRGNGVRAGIAGTLGTITNYDRAG